MAITLGNNLLTVDTGSLGIKSNNASHGAGGGYITVTDANQLILTGGMEWTGNTGSFTARSTLCSYASVDEGVVALGATSGQTIGASVNFSNMERVRVTADGLVGIGRSGPGRKLDVEGGIRVLQDQAATTGAITLRQNSGDTVGAYLQWVDNGVSNEKGWLFVDTSSNMRFATQSTERMRISSSGYVGIGTTSPGNISVLEVPNAITYTVPVTFSGATGANASWGQNFASQAVSSSIYAGYSLIAGNVYAVSDIRLKKEIKPLESNEGLRFINSVDPVSFIWKTTNVLDTGFIAQSLLSKGYGHLVSSVPDKTMEEIVHEDGNVSPAGSRFIVKYDSIVPILHAAIREQQKIIESLSARIEALETK